MIEDFQHVCITCRDIQASVRFYENLGLNVVEPITEFDDKGLAEAMQLPLGHLKVLHLAPPATTSGMFIDLVGINRVAFRVSHIDGTVAALRVRGIVFLSQEPQSFGSIRTIVTTDPDGTFIQLLEWL